MPQIIGLLILFLGSGLVASTVHAGPIRVTIDGTLYDVTFHDDPTSFQSLWDPNGDLDFSDSSLGKAPEFWNDKAGAQKAADAIIGALGSTGITVNASGVTVFESDSFSIPYGESTSPGSPGFIFIVWDADASLDNELRLPQGVDNGAASNPVFTQHASVGGQPWTSFQPVSVPLPLTLMLSIIGLVALGISRGMNRID